MSQKFHTESNQSVALLLASLSVLKGRLDPQDGEAMEALSNVETFCSLSARVLDQTPSYKVRSILRTMELSNMMCPSRPNIVNIAISEQSK